MNIVVLEQNSIGLDIDLTIYEEFGNVTYYGNTVHEVAERIKDADIVIANKARLNEESMKDAPNVKLICEFATGYDNVDLEYCKKRNCRCQCSRLFYSCRCTAYVCNGALFIGKTSLL